MTFKGLLPAAAALAFFSFGGEALAGGHTGGMKGGAMMGSMKDAPVVVERPMAHWGGVYVGGALGIGVNRNDDNYDHIKRALQIADGDDHDDDEGGTTGIIHSHSANARDIADKLGLDEDSGFLGGIIVGYNMQRGRTVFGVEGDVMFGESFDYLASIRGRIGIATGNLHLYATAGVAFLGHDYPDTVDYIHPVSGNPSTSGDLDMDDTHVGFVVGGGVEAQLDHRFTLGFEALYYGFDDDHYNISPAAAPTEIDDINLDKDQFVFRARLTMKFDRLFARAAPAYEPLK